jgi:hypothetical protein
MIGEGAPQLGTSRDIESRQRFVEQEKLGFRHQGASQGHSLGLATGELTGQPSFEAFETRSAEPIRGPCLGDIGLDPALTKSKGDVFEDVEVGKKESILEKDADLPFVSRNESSHLGIIEGHVAECDSSGVDGEQARHGGDGG